MVHAMVFPQLGTMAMLTLVFDLLAPASKAWVLLPPASLGDFSWTRGAALSLLANCALALLQNVSNLGLIGDVGPVTFQVLGSVKAMPTPTSHHVLKWYEVT